MATRHDSVSCDNCLQTNFEVFENFKYFLIIIFKGNPIQMSYLSRLWFMWAMSHNGSHDWASLIDTSNAGLSRLDHFAISEKTVKNSDGIYTVEK